MYCITKQGDAHLFATVDPSSCLSELTLLFEENHNRYQIPVIFLCFFCSQSPLAFFVFCG